MKVLVATSRTQGQRDDDYHWALDGELVRLPGLVCADPDCGCARALAGFGSSKATTTAEVVDRPELDDETYAGMLYSALLREGWLRNMPDDAEYARDWALEHLSLAARFPTGAVVELRDGHLRQRRSTARAG